MEWENVSGWQRNDAVVGSSAGQFCKGLHNGEHFVGSFIVLYNNDERPRDNLLKLGDQQRFGARIESSDTNPARIGPQVGDNARKDREFLGVRK